MATQYDNAIQQLYVAYFNRPADASGITFWANAMANGVTTAQISAAFAASAEYKTEYNDATYTGIVNKVYQNLFGHAPDPTGQAFWVKALNDRTLTIDNVVDYIARGAQGTDADTIAAKVKVATAFTNALDTDAEKAGYAGDEANDAAKALLSTIKTDAQATAAIVPATLDASVAAVIKAGVPFTLANGLAALNAADEAIEEFLAGAEVDLDGDDEIDEDITQDDIATNLDNAYEALEDNIDDPRFADETNAGIRAAIIAAQVEANADALEAADEALVEANEAVADVRGLGNAIAAYTSATEAAEEADDAVGTASISLGSALGGLQAANTAAQFQITGEGDERVISALVDTDDDEETAAERTTIATIVDGEWAFADGYKASDYTGLAAVITAGNALLDAEADAAEAAEAAMFAQLEVEIRDQSEVKTGEVGLEDITFTSGKVTVGENGPTIANIRDELSALRSVENGEDAVQDFLDDVNAFLRDNDTLLADEVESQQAAVEAAQEKIDDLTAAQENLAAAQALVDELEALNEARDAAIADFEANDYTEPMPVDGSHFGTTASDIFVVGTADGTITSFGRSGEDVLYIGSGYTLNTGALTTGNNAVLEVFFVQQGNNTIVTIETETFGSNSAEAEIKITLTGVDAEDLTFENGIITL